MKNYLEYAAKMYYKGSPILSDEEFDSLSEQNNYLEVGTKHASGVAHAYPMYSLQKVYEGEEPPFTGGFRSIKLDGAAVSLTYINGILEIGLTRGDGVRGQPITENLKELNIPLVIKTDKKVLQITGEVAAPAAIKNARNYAAGALNLKSVEEFKTRELDFVAYGVSPSINKLYTEDLYWLIEQGFLTLLDIPTDFYPSDGYVYRIDSNTEFDKLGYTAHHPRGAFALKKQKEGVVTKLEKVIWNVGRSGAVSPVGVFTAVEIDGAIVSRATLHNMRYIEALNLEEGCMVKVIRSGDIIPRIIERIGTEKK